MNTDSIGLLDVFLGWIEAGTMKVALAAREQQRVLAIRLIDSEDLLVFDDRHVAANDLARERHGRTMGVRVRGAQVLEYPLEIERADIRPQDQHADDEAGIADAVGDKRFV